MINHLLLSFCTQSGGPSVILAPQIAPPDYCGLSWFACLFCFWPVGICAILKSNEVTNTDSGILMQINQCNVLTADFHCYSIVWIKYSHMNFNYNDLFIRVLASTRTKCRPIINLEKWRIGLVWLGIPEMYTYTFL